MKWRCSRRKRKKKKKKKKEEKNFSCKVVE
jgi:hypothetical protein